MQGDLRDTSLEQLCRMLDERAATGELAIVHDADSVSVWFRQGRVVRAQSSSHQMRLGDRLVHGGLISVDQLGRALAVQRTSGRQLGEVLVDEGMVNRHVVRVFTQEQLLDSLFACVRWTGGAYSFQAQPGEADEATVPSDLTVAQLLFALESRHRRWNEITRTIPSLDQVPEFVPGADPMSAHLEPGEASIVSAIDGVHSLESIAEDLGFGPFEVATVVHGLAVLGLVRLSSTADATTAAPATATAAPVSDAAAVRRSTDDALSEAAALLLGDDEPATPQPSAQTTSPALDRADADDIARQLADLSDLASADAAPEPAAPAPAAPAAPAPAAPAPAPAAPAPAAPAPAAPAPAPAAPAPAARVEPQPADDDDELAPWAFTIEGEGDEPAEPEPPRRRVAAPITSGGVPVGDTGTGMPLPEPTPEPEPEPEPADPAEAGGRRRTGEMSDLLRELRQLSGE